MSYCQQTLSLKTKQEKSQTWHNGYNLDHKLTEASCGETLLNIHKLYQSKKSLHMYTTKMSRSQLSLEYLLLQAKIFLLEAYKDTHACIHQNLTWSTSLKISYVRIKQLSGWKILMLICWIVTLENTLQTDRLFRSYVYIC